MTWEGSAVHMDISAGSSRQRWLSWAAAALALGWNAASAMAQERPFDKRASVYLEWGSATHRGAATHAVTLGGRSPTQRSFFSGRLHLSWDAYLSRWHADVAPGQRGDFLQVGLVPMWRWRFEGGRSPWFVDAGVGVSYQVHDYVTRTKRFGSRWNFSDHLGVGRSFGADRTHELSVFVKHVSNGGLSSPNPGETFYQLRYGYAF
jgi:lipid A 3-O-deacylase